MPQNRAFKRYLTETEAAEFLSLTVNTLQDWRLRRTGPVYCKFGRAVRYPADGLDSYVQQARVQTAELSA